MLSKIIKYEYARLHRAGRNKAFTLIELLVVISIISMLSSIVLAALSTAKQNAKNAKFQEELISLKNAMALYYSVNNVYPYSPSAPNGAIVNTGSSPTFSSLLSTGLSSYIPSLPDGLSTANNTLLFYAYGTSLPSTDGFSAYHCGSASAPIAKDYVIYFDYAKGGGGLGVDRLYRNLGYGLVVQPYYCIAQ